MKTNRQKVGCSGKQKIRKTGRGRAFFSVGLFFGWLVVTGWTLPLLAKAEETITLGDSLTAEYDTLPNLPGFPTEATAYAEVTREGWEAMSWVEVLARLRPEDFDFGRWRELANPWPLPRLSGYEYNWAIPGAEAGQYESFITTQNPLYAELRRPLESQLNSRAKRAVVWLGGNDFRANYGRLYDGGGSSALIDGLVASLDRIVRFVQAQNREVQIVLATVPDLGAAPAKIAAHPNAAKRQRVTDATIAANEAIAELAADRGVALANPYAQTARLVAGDPFYFGAVEFLHDTDPDNDPHYLFTREGLHPNTALQIKIARTFIGAFNAGYGAGIPQITDAEALRLLRISPREPYQQWIKIYRPAQTALLKDPDRDTLTNLVEYAFGLDPTRSDALPATRTDGPAITITYKPDPARRRHCEVLVQYSLNGASWKRVPADRIVANGDGSFTATLPPQTAPVLTRLKVILRPPQGSNATVASVCNLD
jgi:hypothetical protein